MNKNQKYFKTYLKNYFLANEEKNINMLKNNKNFILDLPFNSKGQLSLFKMFQYELKVNHDHLPYKLFSVSVIHLIFSGLLYSKNYIDLNIAIMSLINVCIFGFFFVFTLSIGFYKWHLLKEKEKDTLSYNDIKKLTDSTGIDTIFFEEIEADKRTFNIFKNRFPEVLLSDRPYTYHQLYNLL